MSEKKQSCGYWGTGGYFNAPSMKNFCLVQIVYSFTIR